MIQSPLASFTRAIFSSSLTAAGTSMKFSFFPLSVASLRTVYILFLRMRARKPMKSFDAAELSEYTLRLLPPRNVLSSRKSFSETSRLLYRVRASSAVFFSDVSIA